MKNPASHRSSETNMTLQKLVQRSFAALFAVLLLLLGSSTAALAHDEVTGTTPANNATVTNVPDKIEVSFTNTPAAIGSFIEVLDESGTNWASGDVQVLDRMATQAVKPGTPAGKFIVKWRLVSSDTHPVEGEFTFTATSAATSTAAAIVGAGPVVSIQAQPPVTTETVRDESSVPWSVIGLGVVLVGLVVALLVVARRRLGKDS